MPLLYYAIQVLLRTPALTPLQNIAHRGGVTGPPEGTLAAFRNAIAQGVDWLEFDVQMTKDGALVVFHDETVERTTNGTGKVSDLTLDQIRALDAGQGEKVPTFTEVLDLAKTSGVKILPETKFANIHPEVDVKLILELEQAGYLDQTIIQSFETVSLTRLKTVNPQAKLCALYGLWEFNVSSPPGDAQVVCPMSEMVLLNPAMIRQAHQEGRQVFIYFGVIENPMMMKIMRFFGADGLIVNDPMMVKGR
jgi:glycerophosphoryl diester phosphodiesterase